MQQRHRVQTAIVTLVAMGIVGVAQAEPDPAPARGLSLEEVIVTATKRAENIQNIPVTISAMTADTLIRRGITRTQDLSGSVSSLVVMSAHGKAQPNFNLRGVGVANEFNPNIASPIGLYVDENYLSFRASHGQQIYDLERIEVVKGPQGTLYGRNTTGGAINIITRKPTLGDTNGYVQAGYGNYDRWKLAGAVEGTLISDRLGVRVAGILEKGDGWQKNVDPDNARVTKDFNSVNNVAGRVIFRLKPSDDINIHLKGYIARDNPIGAAVTTKTPLGTDFFGYSRNGLKKNEFEVDTLGELYVKTYGVQLTFDWELGDTTFTSITGYDRARYKNQTDCDGAPITECSADYDSKSEQFNQDVRLTYSSDGLKLIGGLYYGWDQINNDPRFCIFCDPAHLTNFNPPIFTPAAIASGLLNLAQPLGALIAHSHFDQTRASYAGYAEGSYELAEKLKVTLGLRFTHDDYLYANGRTILFGPDRVTPMATSVPLTFPIDLTVPGIRRDGSIDKLTGRLIVDYHVTDDVMVFASYSRGYRAGSFNGLSYQDESQIYLVAPETLQAYEAGIKSQFWNKRVQFNASAFYYDYGNQQTQTCHGGICSLGGANARVIGFDADLTAQVLENFRLTAGLGLLDSKYDKGEIIANRPVGGNPVPYAPKVTANIGAEWNIIETSLGNVDLYAEGQYVGKMFYEPYNGETKIHTRQVQEGYWLVNTRLSLTSEKYTFALWAKNLFDKVYYPYAGDQTTFIGMEYFVRGTPRTYGAEVQINF